MSSQNLSPDGKSPPGKVSIDNQAPNQGMQGVARDVTIHHHHGPAAPPTPSTLTARQRAELLDRLKLRYQELLDHALAHQVRLQLGLHTRPDAVDPAWRRMLLRGPRASSQPVQPSTPLLELFDGQQGQLLVLGAPGAGKTTLIIELAQALTVRALADGQARIPVLVNVAAWRSGLSLRDWLVPTLRDLLGASKRFAAQLAASDDLLLLLDGLDEVAADHRAACVAAINTYLGERDLAPLLVVGCRSREYTDMGTRLVIAGAVELEPLELPVIEQVLVEVPAAQGVLLALQTDTLLRELATTPLMVNVLLLAHGGQEVPLVQTRTVEERRQMLWGVYVRRMLAQQPTIGRPSQRELHTLRWLTQRLRRGNATNIHVNNFSALLLHSVALRWGFRGSLVVFWGLVGALVGALTLGPDRILISGLVVGLLVGLEDDQGEWLGLVLALGVAFGLALGFGIGLLVALGMGLSFTLNTLLQRHGLRLALACAGLFPFRAVTFLNAMSERLLLERDGAFYRFRHLLLRDFIADLSDDDIARLAREIEGEGVSR